MHLESRCNEAHHILLQSMRGKGKHTKWKLLLKWPCWISTSGEQRLFLYIKKLTWQLCHTMGQPSPMLANMLLWNIWHKPISSVHSWWIPSVVYPWCLLIHCHPAPGCFQTCQKNKMASIFAFRSYSIFTHANKNKSLLFKEGARSIINFLRGPSVWHVLHACISPD